MKIMFYSVHSVILPHSLPESHLVRILRGQGHDISYTTCGEAFVDLCTCMLSEGLTEASPVLVRKDVCRRCTRSAEALATFNGIKSFVLSDWLEDSDYDFVEEIAGALNPDDYLSFSHLNVEVARLATYEPMLRFKKMSAHFSLEEWPAYKTSLKNSLLSLIGFSRIFEAEKPEMVIAYSPQYGVNNVVLHYAHTFGVPGYFIEGSSSNAERYAALRVWKWKGYSLLDPALKYWQLHDRLTGGDIERLGGHFEELLVGRSFAVYSLPMRSAYNVRDQLKIPRNVKLILASLSSADEAYSAYLIGGFPESKIRSNVFPSQFEWIRETIRFLAERPDVYLVIRLHPRDVPNKRESVESEQFGEWQKLLTNLPGNVVVNWPKDNISIYDLFKEADLVLTGWSATGIEAMAFGHPVVTYDQNLPSYPPEIHFTGVSKEEYFRNIERALSEGWQFRHTLSAFRWLGLKFSMGTVRIPVTLYSVLTEKQGRVFYFLRRAVTFIVRRWGVALILLLDRIVLRRFHEDEAKFVRLIREKGDDLYSILPMQEGQRIDQAVLNQAMLLMESLYRKDIPGHHKLLKYIEKLKAQ